MAASHWESFSLQHSQKEGPGRERLHAPEDTTHTHSHICSLCVFKCSEIVSKDQRTHQEEILFITVHCDYEAERSGVHITRTSVQIQEGGGIKHTIHLHTHKTQTQQIKVSTQQSSSLKVPLVSAWSFKASLIHSGEYAGIIL